MDIIYTKNDINPHNDYVFGVAFAHISPFSTDLIKHKFDNLKKRVFNENSLFDYINTLDIINNSTLDEESSLFDTYFLSYHRWGFIPTLHSNYQQMDMNYENFFIQIGFILDENEFAIFNKMDKKIFIQSKGISEYALYYNDIITSASILSKSYIKDVIVTSINPVIEDSNKKFVSVIIHYSQDYSDIFSKFDNLFDVNMLVPEVDIVKYNADYKFYKKQKTLLNSYARYLYTTLITDGLIIPDNLNYLSDNNILLNSKEDGSYKLKSLLDRNRKDKTYLYKNQNESCITNLDLSNYAILNRSVRVSCLAGLSKTILKEYKYDCKITDGLYIDIIYLYTIYKNFYIEDFTYTSGITNTKLFDLIYNYEFIDFVHLISIWLNKKFIESKGRIYYENAYAIGYTYNTSPISAVTDIEYSYGKPYINIGNVHSLIYTNSTDENDICNPVSGNGLENNQHPNIISYLNGGSDDIEPSVYDKLDYSSLNDLQGYVGQVVLYK